MILMYILIILLGTYLMTKSILVINNLNKDVCSLNFDNNDVINNDINYVKVKELKGKR